LSKKSDFVLIFEVVLLVENTLSYKSFLLVKQVPSCHFQQQNQQVIWTENNSFSPGFSQLDLTQQWHQLIG
jgi:hypothetical protein